MRFKWLILAAVVWWRPDGHGCRPAAAEPPAHADENVELIRQLMQRRGGDPAALAQLVQLTRECSPPVTAELFEELAEAHRRAGDLNLAAATRQLLVERFPDEPAARSAVAWLLRLYASSEVAHARRPPPQNVVAGGLALAAAQEPAKVDGSAGEGASNGSESDTALVAYALGLANQAHSLRPALVDDPAIQFQRSVAARRAGQDKAAQGFLVPLKHARAGDPWGDAARMENWLAGARDSAPPKLVVSVVRSAAPPHLDGVLSEPYWQGEAMRLSEANAWLAADDRYLYFAVKCAKAVGVEYPPDAGPRPHDGAADRFDNVRLLLDLDRDYATWFEFVVDSRGWTAERAWDDAAWNPEWFVAASETPDAWAVEAAIPIAELAPRPSRSADAWACRVERRLPSGIEHSCPAGDAGRTPGGFAVAIFD